MFVIFVLVPTRLKGFVLIAGIVCAVAAGWRALRLSIEVDASNIVVKNYWLTHRFSWQEVEEIRPVAVTIGVLPRRALGFQLRSGGLICAQGTGGPLRVRAAALAVLRSYAGKWNVAISPELAREMAGSGDGAR